MAGSFPNQLETALLDFIFDAAALTITGTRVLALYTGDPGETVTDGTAGEQSGGGYARTAITFSSAALSGDLGKIQNSGDIVFPTATSQWLGGADISGWAIFNTGGATQYALMHGDFLAGKPVLNGDVAKVLNDNLSLTLD